MAEMTSKKRILLITQYYYPNQAIGALRWSRLVRYLSEDFDFFVVYTNKENSLERAVAANGEVAKYPFTESGIPINKNGKFHPPRKKKLLQRIFPKSKTVLRIYKLLSLPDPSWRWGKRVRKEIQQIAEARQFDLIIASYPNLGSLRLASWLSQKKSIPWIADFRDPVTEYLHATGPLDRLLRPWMRSIEKKLLCNCSRIVAINGPIARMTLSPASVLKNVVTNNFDAREFLPYGESPPNNELPLIIGYFGSIQQKSDMKIWFDALSRIHQQSNEFDNKIKIHYYGDSAVWLESELKKRNLPPGLLVNHGKVARKMALEKMQQSDALLAFGWLGKHPEAFDTGKIFDYVGSGRPILLISSTGQSGNARVVEKSSAGVVFSDTDQIVDFLTEALHSKMEVLDRLSRQRNADNVFRFSSDYCSKLYKKYLDEVILSSSNKKRVP